MIHHENIDSYLEWCRSNRNKVNKLRLNAIKNIYIPTLEDETVFFDSAMYEKCIKFCEVNYYPLIPFQKFIYAFVFMYRDNIPVFNTFVICMGRGNGKDGAFMPLMHFLTTPLHGIKNYHVDIIANNESQAKDSFNVVYDCLEENSKKFKGLYHWTLGSIKNIKTGAEIRYNTSNAKTKDGKKSGAIFFNEYHAYETYDSINVFSSQLGKIENPRTFIVSTFGYVRGGPMDDLMDLCTQICLSGQNELGYFPFICCMDSESEIDNPDLWIKANPSIEYMPVLKNQIMKDYREMKKLSSKRPEFLTKRMNIASRDDEVTVASWEDILRTSYTDNVLKIPRLTPELENEMCVIGIDYADIRDFATAGCLFRINGEYIWRSKTWICKNSPFFENIKFPFVKFGEDEFSDFEILDSKSLSIEAIVDWCVDMMDLYSVQKIVMDTYRFSLFREQFEMHGISIETKQDPNGLVRMIRSQGAIQALTIPTIEKAFSEHTINFGPSAIMRWFTNNTGVRIDKMGNKAYEKIEPKLRKNDGFMAFMSAMSCESLLQEQIIYI